MEEKVIVIIDKNGEVSIDIEGAVGPACKDITEAVKRRLGGTTIESRDKPAMYSEIDHMRQKVYNS